MNHWPFIIAAYAVTALAMGVLVSWSFVGMRRAERQAAEIGRRP